jgi:hypothetical protein
MARKRVSDAPAPIEPISRLIRESSARATESAPSIDHAQKPPDLNLGIYFNRIYRECKDEISRWREPGNEHRWPIERERASRLLKEVKRVADEISAGSFDQSYCARVQARLQLLNDDWEMVCRARDNRQSMIGAGKETHNTQVGNYWTKPVAKKFALEYIAAEQRSGRAPTQVGMLNAAKANNKRAGRDLLRKAFNDHMRELGTGVRRGRPKKLVTENRGK